MQNPCSSASITYQQTSMRARIVASFIQFICLAATLITCLACTPYHPTNNSQAPTLGFAFTNSADSATVTTTNMETYIDLYSPSGIGQLDVMRNSGTWPSAFHLRLHLAGLEYFSLHYENRIHTIEISSSGDQQIIQILNDAHATQQLNAAHPAWLDVQILTQNDTPGLIPLQEGTILIRLPEALRTLQTTHFSCSWIDFYR